jgi:hypothetical protein
MGIKYTIKISGPIHQIDGVVSVIKAEFLDWLTQQGLICNLDYIWSCTRSDDLDDTIANAIYITFNDQNLATLCKLTWT